MTSKILIFGTGGVGGIYAVLLEKAGASVTCVCRSNHEAVLKDGILVRSMKWGHIRSKPNTVKHIQDAVQYGPFDYIIVCSKAFPGTALQIQPTVTPAHTAIVLAQNGIDIEEEHAQLFPTNNIISGVVYLPTTQVLPGIIEHGGTLERLEIGPHTTPSPSTSSSQLITLSNLFTAANASAPVHTDIAARRWNKLALNAALNPTTALTLCDDANLLRSDPVRASNLLRRIMREIAAIATAAGYPDAVTEEEIEAHLERHLGRMETGGKEPSMLVDVRCGRAMEVEAILGNAVRRAEGLGVRVEALELIYVLAKARDFALRRGEGWREILTVG